jgi:hypothetical protein
MLDEEACEISSAVPLRIPAGRFHEPEEGAACHCGLYEEHISVCDMAEDPLDQLAVIRDSVHAELNVLDAISNIDPDS